MKIDQIQKIVNTLVKVVFKARDERSPMIGKFVNLRDSEELAKKGMIRFVNQSRLEYYNVEHPEIGLTKIYVASDIADILIMKPSTVK